MVEAMNKDKPETTTPEAEVKTEGDVSSIDKKPKTSTENTDPWVESTETISPDDQEKLNNIRETAKIEKDLSKLSLETLHLRGLEKPDVMKETIRKLLEYYNKTKNQTKWWARNNPFDGLKYSKEAKKWLKEMSNSSKNALQVLENYEKELANGKYRSIPDSMITTVSAFIIKLQGFDDKFAKAAAGERTRTTWDLNTKKGVEKELKRSEKYKEYLTEINDTTFKAALLEVENKDQEDFREYLVRIIEGDIKHPSVEPYFQKHRADILYLACLNPALLDAVRKYHNITTLSPEDLWENWPKLVALQEKGYKIDKWVNAPLGGVRWLLRDGIEKITPNMNPCQREMWAQLAEMGGLIFTIFQVGKRVFKGEGKLGRIAILGGVLLGGSFLSQWIAGKNLWELVSAALNGGPAWDEIVENTTSIFSRSPDFIKKPLGASCLFTGMTVAEARALTQRKDKANLYAELEAKYKSENPKNIQALKLLSTMDKNDPSVQLKEYYSSIIAKEDPSLDNKKIEEIVAQNMDKIWAIGRYLNANPEMTFVEDEKKQEEFLAKFKDAKAMEDMDIEKYVKEGYFVVDKKYNSAYRTEIKKIAMDQDKKLQLYEQLYIFESDKSASFKEISINEDWNARFISHKQTLSINLKEGTIDWLEQRHGTGLDKKLRFQDRGELLRIADLVNKIKNEYWKVEPDEDKRWEENRPFEVSDGWIFKGGIAMGAHNWDKSAVSNNRLPRPFSSEMKKKYKSLETESIKLDFIAYLNTQREKDHTKK